MQNVPVVVVKVLQFKILKINYKYSLNKSGFILGFFLLAIIGLHAQQQVGYQLNKERDIALGAGLGTMFLTSYYLDRQVKPLPDAEILALRREDINRFDRIATYRYSGVANATSDLLLVGSIAIKAYFIVNKKTRKNAFNIGVVSLQSIALAQGLANTCKLTLRNRPLMYNENVPMDVKRQGFNRLSFFSAHTVTVSAACFSFAYAYQTYLPESKYKNVIWFYAITAPVVEGLLRVAAGKHYFTDTITAYVVGFGTSYLMHRLHLPKKKQSLGFLIKEPVNR